MSAWDAVDHSNPLEDGLWECSDDREVCVFGCCCPCVLVSRTAEFVGEDGWICAGAWCCLEMPCCIGAILRRRLALALGLKPPPFHVACCFNHCIAMPCSLCQEARLVQKMNFRTFLQGPTFSLALGPGVRAAADLFARARREQRQV